eukprot:sb/3464880/
MIRKTPAKRLRKSTTDKPAAAAVPPPTRVLPVRRASTRSTELPKKTTEPTTKCSAGISRTRSFARTSTSQPLQRSGSDRYSFRASPRTSTEAPSSSKPTLPPPFTKQKPLARSNSNVGKRPLGPPSMLSRAPIKATVPTKVTKQPEKPPPAPPKRAFTATSRVASGGISKRKPIPPPKSSTSSKTALSSKTAKTRANPISKAKQKGTSTKSNFAKNMSLNISLNSTKDGSKKTGLSGLLQGILGDAAQPEKENIIDLQSDAEKILGKAKMLLSKSDASSSSELLSSRPVPAALQKNIKQDLYCKDCRLEFPTPLLRDLHYKTEIHCFVSGLWWKSNPKPPTKLPTKSTEIFCVVCWEKMAIQGGNTQLNVHLTSKDHTACKKKYGEIFGKTPLYHWCLWEDFSVQFRKKYRPSLIREQFPRHFYEQRVIRK